MGYITCLLTCCTYVLAPTLDWTPQDEAALHEAMATCRTHKECLIKFTKKEQGLYSAICGDENNK